jgi:hypothetical protein
MKVLCQQAQNVWLWMKIESDFSPDVIVHFVYSEGSNKFHLNKIWGDSILLHNTIEYLKSLFIKKENCLVCLQRGTLKYKIIPFEIKDET